MRRFKLSVVDRHLLKELLEVGESLSDEIKRLSLGAFLQLVRKRLHMTQGQLAKRSRVSQTTIAKLESNRLNPSLQTLQRLYAALDCQLIPLPAAWKSSEEIIRRQATKLAKQRLDYLKGTLLLEDQLPEEEVLDDLLEEQIQQLIESGSSEIWDV